jgi:hypothetical protein
MGMSHNPATTTTTMIQARLLSGNEIVLFSEGAGYNLGWVTNRLS